MKNGGGRGGANKNKALHASYIDVHSIKTGNNEMFIEKIGDRNNQTANDQKLNLAEMNLIHKLSERRDLFALLVKSVCPSIFGNELVKTG
jgi:DNA replicative helicase MCM subunit Mcm2 (Cdc46/Mcm family)